MTVAPEMTKTTSPQRDKMNPESQVIADWLASNGIDELIPGEPTFLVRDDEIIYRAFQFTGGRRGHNTDDLVDGYVQFLEEDRVVPLLAPVTDEVRDAFEKVSASDSGRAFLVEVLNGSSLADPMDAYRKRLGIVDGPTDRLGYLSWDGDRGTKLDLTVAGDKLQVAVGPVDTKPNEIPRRDPAGPVVFEFSERNVQSLIKNLPRLHERMQENLNK